METIQQPNSQIKMPSVCQWMRMTQKQVLDKFQGIPGSYTDGKNQERFVYISGKRKDRVLLVAHADTVFWWLENGDDSGIKLQYDGDIVKSAYAKEYELTLKNGKKIIKKPGIGADDRAGCKILWELRSLGHSLLITSGEEQGCIATHRIIKSKFWRKEINNHQFAVQFDRRGENDIVFYEVGTNKFVKYVEEQTGYITEDGSVTDISYLCIDICGVNMSVGYKHEHTDREQLNIKHFNNTLEVARKWLEKPNIPRFEINKKDRYRHYKCANKYYDQDFALEYAVNSKCPSDINTSMIVCPNCKKQMLQERWLKSQFMCENCGERI